MFSGEEFVRFTSSESQETINQRVESALDSLGLVEHSSRGTFFIRPKRSLQGTFVKTTLDGDLRQRDGTYTVTIEYTCTLTAFGWFILILGILFFFSGLLVLLAPLLKKNDVARSVRRALRDIE
jgi:hypothetical protein